MTSLSYKPSLLIVLAKPFHKLLRTKRRPIALGPLVTAFTCATVELLIPNALAASVVVMLSPAAYCRWGLALV